MPAYLMTNLDTALHRLRTLRVDAKRLPDPYLLARVYEEMAQVFYEKGQSDSLGYFSELALRNFLASDHPAAALDALVIEGNMAQDANDDARAMEVGFKLVERAQALNNQVMEAEGYWLISTAFYYQAQFEESNYYGDKFLETGKSETPDISYLSRLLSQAESYREAKDTVNTLRLFRQAEAALRDQTMPSLMAQYGLGYGKWLLDLGEFNEAEAVLTEGLQNAIASGTADIQAEITGNLGKIYHVRGEYERAKRAYQQHLASMAESGDPKLIGLFEDYLAETYAELGQFDSAYHFMQSGYENYRVYVADDYQTQIARQQTAYETAEKDARIAAQQNRLWLIGGGLLLAILAGGYLLLLSRRLRRRNA
ncbi:MAG: hypothetical protein AAF597_11650, partial [Bacteroidota bacterium]